MISISVVQKRNRHSKLRKLVEEVVVQRLEFPIGERITSPSVPKAPLSNTALPHYIALSDVSFPASGGEEILTDVSLLANHADIWIDQEADRAETDNRVCVLDQNFKRYLLSQLSRPFMGRVIGLRFQNSWR